VSNGTQNVGRQSGGGMTLHIPALIDDHGKRRRKKSSENWQVGIGVNLDFNSTDSKISNGPLQEVLKLFGVVNH
jgi:hypothetical protein